MRRVGFREVGVSGGVIGRRGHGRRTVYQGKNANRKVPATV